LLIYDSIGVESEFIKINVKHPKVITALAKFYTKIYGKLVCRLADIIFTVSDVDRNYYIENYKIKRSKTFLVQIPTSLNFQNQPRTEETKNKYRNKLGLSLNNVKKFKNNNLISLGFVEELKDLLLVADFTITPIISGIGMRVKCSDYIVGAIPFVTTKKGIEGLDFLKPPIDYLVSDKVDDEFIANI